MALPLVWTHRPIAVEPAVVWDVLTDPARWGDWGPTVRGGRLDPPGRFETGATGTVRTALGVALRFRLREVDPGRRWSWRVAGIPATVHAVEAIDGGCRAGMGVPAPAAPYLPVCAIGLRRIEDIVLGG